MIQQELMQKSFVNISLDGGGLTVKQLVDRYVSTKITPHMCRHTYCTRIAGTGISVYTLSKLMGHSSIEITMDVYAHADTEQARAELKRIKPKLDELNQSADKIISMPNLA